MPKGLTLGYGDWNACFERLVSPGSTFFRQLVLQMLTGLAKPAEFVALRQVPTLGARDHTSLLGTKADGTFRIAPALQASRAPNRPSYPYQKMVQTVEVDVVPSWHLVGPLRHII